MVNIYTRSNRFNVIILDQKKQNKYLYIYECRFLILFGDNIIVEPSSGSQKSFKNTCKKYGIQVYFRRGKTIKDLLVAPKDRDHITQKSGIIYRYKCDRVECDDEYIGETARTFGERFKEHLKHPSPIYDHSNITGHNTTLDNFSIVGREDQNLMRLIKKAIYIRVNGPSLNKT